MSFFLSVAWRNLLRNGRRTAITAVAMGVGVALCMSMWAWANGMMGQMFDLLVTRQLGHVQVQHADYRAKHQLYDTVEGTAATLARIDALPDVTAATGRLVTYGLVGSEKVSAGARLVGIDPAREDAVSGVSTRLKSGRFLLPTDARVGLAIPAVLGADLARKLEVGVGDEVVMITQAADGSLANELFEIEGTFRTGNAAMDRAGVYVPLAELQQVLALDDQVHEIVITGRDDDGAASLAEHVRGAVPEGLWVQTWFQADPITAQMMGMTDGMMVVLLLVVFSVAGLGVLNTMLMAVFERTRELGLLKALGLKPRQVVLLILTESGLLALLAAGGGAVLGLLLDWYLVVYGIDLSISEGKGFEYEGVEFDPVIKATFDWPVVGVTLVAVIAVCLLASLWPAIRASRLRPVDAMRKG